MVMIEDRWLSADEVADYLNVKKGTVYKWIETQNVPAHKFGHVWKFRMKEIAEWVRVIGTGDRETEDIATDTPRCKMTLRYSPYWDARLNIDWNWRVWNRDFGNC
jgi:excisionase family DNA binding protein